MPSFHLHRLQTTVPLPQLQPLIVDKTQGLISEPITCAAKCRTRTGTSVTSSRPAGSDPGDRDPLPAGQRPAPGSQPPRRGMDRAWPKLPPQRRGAQAKHVPGPLQQLTSALQRSGKKLPAISSRLSAFSPRRTRRSSTAYTQTSQRTPNNRRNHG